MVIKRGHETSVARLVISIVLFRPELHILENFFLSLSKALGPYSASLNKAIRIVLIDHSPDLMSADCLKKLSDLVGERTSIIYDYVGNNPGYGAGHNYAFHQAKDADYFLVANPDLEFLPDSLGSAIEYLDNHQDVGLIAPVLVEPDGSERPACFRYPALITLLSRLMNSAWADKRNHLYEYRDWDSTKLLMNPELISGCCMLFRNSLFARLRGFDTRYFLYFEDFDLSLRANTLTNTCCFPGMKVKHFGGGAGRKGIRHIYYFLKSAFIFFSKHGLHHFKITNQ